MKRRINSTLVLLMFTNLLFALPRFAVQEGASCNLCHVNPTGGSLRNDYGTTVFALEELPMHTMQKFGDEDWDGYVGDFLQIGGDFRVQGFAYKTDKEQKTALFPMQADIYANLEINEKAGIYYKMGLGPLPRPEYWMLLSVLSNDGWIRIGKTLPNYGLKLDDHTSFIRGGNLRRTHTTFSEGMAFDPFQALPGIVEVGYHFTDKINLTYSIANGFIKSSDAGYGYSEEFSDKNFAGKISYVNTFYEYLNTNVNVSFMQESDFQLAGISGGMSLGNLTWTGEIDQAQNWPEGETALASYNELVYKFKQGIHFVGKYDFYDPDLDLTSGAITRYTLGVEIFPLNILEVKLQSRFTQLDLEGANQPDPEYLIQFHTWF